MRIRLFVFSIIILLSAQYSYTQIPTQYELYQNVPDPFDTTGTYFQFDIAEDSARVYIFILNNNVNVATLLTVNKYSAGHYQIYWNAKGSDSLYIAPGVYMCKMYVVFDDRLAIAFKDSIHIHFQRNVDVQENTNNDIPFEYSLNQNYPNPFNPSTVISFSIPRKSIVSLKIFNVSGREVTTLVSDELIAGTYFRRWNAANMPNGVYFYRLIVQKYSNTKKLILLK